MAFIPFIWRTYHDDCHADAYLIDMGGSLMIGTSLVSVVLYSYASTADFVLPSP